MNSKGHGGLVTAALPALCPEVEMLALLATEQHDGANSQILLRCSEGHIVGTVQMWAS
jgi:hypothetical protein